VTLQVPVRDTLHRRVLRLFAVGMILTGIAVLGLVLGAFVVRTIARDRAASLDNRDQSGSRH
jgi:hypothetical protein